MNKKKQTQIQVVLMLMKTQEDDALFYDIIKQLKSRYSDEVIKIAFDLYLDSHYD